MKEAGSELDLVLGQRCTVHIDDSADKFPHYEKLFAGLQKEARVLRKGF